MALPLAPSSSFSLCSVCRPPAVMLIGGLGGFWVAAGGAAYGVGFWLAGVAVVFWPARPGLYIFLCTGWWGCGASVTAGSFGVAAGAVVAVGLLVVKGVASGGFLSRFARQIRQLVSGAAGGWGDGGIEGGTAGGRRCRAWLVF